MSARGESDSGKSRVRLMTTRRGYEPLLDGWLIEGCLVAVADNHGITSRAQLMHLSGTVCDPGTVTTGRGNLPSRVMAYFKIPKGWW